MLAGVFLMTGCASTPAGSGGNRNTALWIATYPVNRVLDVLDVVSVSVGPGGGLYADVHATRAAQLSLGIAADVGVGWWYQRELGLSAEAIYGAGFGPWSAERNARALR